MTTRASTAGLPTPSAARFGRGRTLSHGNIVFMSRRNDDNDGEVATARLTQYPAEPDRTPDPPPHTIMARQRIAILDQATHPLSP